MQDARPCKIVRLDPFATPSARFAQLPPLVRENIVQALTRAMHSAVSFHDMLEQLPPAMHRTACDLRLRTGQRFDLHLTKASSRRMIKLIQARRLQVSVALTGIFGRVLLLRYLAAVPSLHVDASALLVEELPSFVSELAGLTALTELCLRDFAHSIARGHHFQLAGLTALQELRLINCGRDTGLIQAVRELAHLTSLDLTKNLLASSDVEALVMAMLPAARTRLRHLCLDDNRVWHWCNSE